MSLKQEAKNTIVRENLHANENYLQVPIRLNNQDSELIVRLGDLETTPEDNARIKKIEQKIISGRRVSKTERTIYNLFTRQPGIS